MTLDIGFIIVAFGLAFLLRLAHEHIPLLQQIPSVPWLSETAARSDYAVLLGVSLVAWILSLKRSGAYVAETVRRPGRILLTQMHALALAGLVTGAVVFILKMHSISRLFFAYYFGASFVLLFSKDLVLATVLRSLARSGVAKRHALVIGAGRPAAWFARVLKDAEAYGYELVGLLLAGEVGAAGTFDIPVLGAIDDIDRVLTEHPVDEVFIVGGAAEIATLATAADSLIKKGRVVSLLTSLASGEDGICGRVTEFSGIPMISFGPMPRDGVELTLKRLVDSGVAAVGLIILAPVCALVSLAIKIFDPGPLIFSQERLGYRGEVFRLHKFRSMRVNADGVLKADPELYMRYVANDYKLPENQDPRISRLGRLLRKSSLDEIPQLWNVLQGDMSLVGPRPIVPAEIEKYEPYAELFLSVRPGVTGRWQVNGRSKVRYPERAFMDFDYIGTSSLGSDLSILAKTLPAVFWRKGAH